MADENKYKQKNTKEAQSLVGQEQIIEALQSNIRQSFDELENGETYSMNEVKYYLEI